MRKNNIWNKLFHKAEVQENVKQMSICTKQCLEGHRFLDRIEGPNTLITLMDIHREAWEAGFQNENIGPDRYGVFRTSDILSSNIRALLAKARSNYLYKRLFI